MRLRQCVLVLILLVFTCGYVTAAPNLQKFGHNDASGTYFMDVNSIKYIPNPFTGITDNNFIEVIEVLQLTPQGKKGLIKFRKDRGLPTPGFEKVSAVIEVVQLDIKGQKMRNVKYVWFSDKAEALFSWEAPPGVPFAPIGPGTIGQSGLEFAVANLPNASVQQNPVKSGTGFFITSNLVVTNYHVISDANDIRVTYKNDTILPATLVSKDPQNDLALLRVNGLENIVTPLVMGNVREVKEGNTVYTMGYPMPDELGSRAKMSQGIINSVTGYKDDLRMFQISIPVQPGNSGGPLINAKGEVVGVVTAGMGLKFLYDTGVLPQNVNYAMKINYILNFINTLPEEVALPITANRGEITATRIAEISKEAVVFISAQ